MDNHPAPRQQFADSLKAFSDSLQAMDKFDRETDGRDLTTAEQVEAVFRFSNLMYRMFCGFRDLDALILKPEPQPLVGVFNNTDPNVVEFGPRVFISKGRSTRT